MNWLLDHWLWFAIPLSILSTLYTIGSVWWTLHAERRFRWLKQELLIQKLAYARLHNTVENVQGYLEKDETLRRVVIPLVKRS